MASGAQIRSMEMASGPAAAGQAGPGLAGTGFYPSGEAMMATPVSRRLPASAPTLGNSPPAKRATRRGAAAPDSSQPPQLDALQLATEVRTLFAQSQADQQHFDATTDVLNDHALGLDKLRAEFDQMRRDMVKITEDVQNNDDNLKTNLAKLEGVVRRHGNAQKADGIQESPWAI